MPGLGAWGGGSLARSGSAAEVWRFTRRLALWQGKVNAANGVDAVTDSLEQVEFVVLIP